MKGFIPHIIENTETEALYHIEATASATYKIGEALKLSSGKVALDNDGSYPEYFCRTAVTLDGNGGIVACAKPRQDIIYETEVAYGGITSANPGTRVAIAHPASDDYADQVGMTICDADTGDDECFEIVWAEGTAAGKKALVRLL